MGPLDARRDAHAKAGLAVPTRRLHFYLRCSALALLSLLLGSCSTGSDPVFLETTEVIPLPPELSSYKAANQIGSDVHHALSVLMENDPERFNPREVGFQVNWGQMKNLETEESVFFIKLVGKSTVPIEGSPAAQALMHHGITTVYRILETEETLVSR